MSRAAVAPGRHSLGRARWGVDLAFLPPPALPPPGLCRPHSSPLASPLGKRRPLNYSHRHFSCHIKDDMKLIGKKVNLVEEEMRVEEGGGAAEEECAWHCATSTSGRARGGGGQRSQESMGRGQGG